MGRIRVDGGWMATEMKRCPTRFEARLCQTSTTGQNAEYGGPERSQSAKHIQINPVAILRHRVTL